MSEKLTIECDNCGAYTTSKCAIGKWCQVSLYGPPLIELESLRISPTPNHFCNVKCLWEFYSRLMEKKKNE